MTQESQMPTVEAYSGHPPRKERELDCDSYYTKMATLQAAIAELTREVEARDGH